MKITYRPGCENVGADALSRNPDLENKSSLNLDKFVLQVSTREQNISHLLTATQTPTDNVPVNNLHQKQRKDPKPVVFFDYLENNILPQDIKAARKTAALATKFATLDKVLYFIDQKKAGRRRAVVYPVTYKVTYCKSTMEEKWLGTFLVTDYVPLYAIIGIGRMCMLMLLLLVGIVLSMIWLQVWGERRDHPYIQYP